MKILMRQVFCERSFVSFFECSPAWKGKRHGKHKYRHNMHPVPQASSWIWNNNHSSTEQTKIREASSRYAMSDMFILLGSAWVHAQSHANNQERQRIPRRWRPQRWGAVGTKGWTKADPELLDRCILGLAQGMRFLPEAGSMPTGWRMWWQSQSTWKLHMVQHIPQPFCSLHAYKKISIHSDRWGGI